MALTRRETVALVSAFGAVLLTGLIHIGIREWYQADLRYEEGAYYISGQTAVASLRVTNKGRSDAEDVTITARFDRPVKGVSLDSRSLTLSTLAGGPGQRFVTTRVDRLVPDQQVSLFFAVEYQGAREGPETALCRGNHIQRRSRNDRRTNLNNQERGLRFFEFRSSLVCLGVGASRP